MAVVDLEILKPKDSQRFIGATSPAGGNSGKTKKVSFKGEVKGHPKQVLYLKWYSSLNTNEDNNYAIHAAEYDPAHPQQDSFSIPLTVGSHVITFTAKDVEADDLASLRRVELAGMTGGPPKPERKDSCVIHVLIAEIVKPLDNETVIDEDVNNLELIARCPFLWGDEKYNKNINQLEYHWSLATVNDPDIPVWESSPSSKNFIWEDEKPTELKYEKTGFRDLVLPGNDYRLTLKVIDKQASSPPSADAYDEETIIIHIQEE
jgi:hypothetical protein